MIEFVKDPQATLDYKWDWQAGRKPWLLSEETITTATVTGPDDITVTNVDHDDTTVTAWFSGGEVGTTYLMVCHIETDQGRADDRTLRLKVQNT